MTHSLHARARAIGRGAAALRPRTILVAAWAVLVVYAFPGYLSWDSGEQLYQVRIDQYDDWHPPMMAACWRWLEYVVRGPFGMLVVQASLFLWGLHALLRHRLGERAAAWTAAALYLYPPIFTPMAMVWKDAQMAGFLAAGLALALRAGWRARLLGVGLLVLGTSMRDNAPAALPTLMLWVAAAWGCRRWLPRVAVGVVLFAVVAAGAALANRQVTDQHAYAWYRTSATHDIAGVIAHAGPMSDAELRPLLADTGLAVEDDLQARIRRAYSPRVWFSLAFGPDQVWHHTGEVSTYLARGRAWRALVRAHPRAFLAHRWAVTRHLLGLTADPIWEPVGQTVGANDDHRNRVRHDHTLSWFQRRLGGWYQDHLAGRIFYRAWAYVLVALVLLGYALWRRDRMLVALLGSGLAYEAGFAAVTAAPDWRYSQWLVTMTCASAAVIFLERLRAGRRPAAGPTAVAAVAAVAVAAALVGGCGDDATPPRVLVYSRTLGYRHADAIEAGIPALTARLAADGLAVDATEDSWRIRDADLDGVRVVVFLYTTGDDILDADGKRALERHIRGGGGWVGVHSATDTEYTWPFYGEVVVSYFAAHPAIQPATVHVEDAAHPATALAPSPWQASDEWYDFQTNPRATAGVRVLLTVDESSYSGGAMGADHPIAWAHERLGGRVFYTALGHVADRWSEPAFVEHVAGGVRWAAGADD